MQGLQDEINGLLEFAKVSSVHQIEAAPEGKPYEGLFTASQDYFTVYHVNAALVMQINDASLRRSIIQIYTRAKWLLDTLKMNRLYLERFHYLQSTFLKTREQSVQAEAEEYHQTLIAMAGQVKRAQAEFKKRSKRIVEHALGTHPGHLICTRINVAEFSRNNPSRRVAPSIVHLL